MDDINNIQPTPPRRRKRKTKWQIFKEAYLPVLIIIVAFVLIIIFIAGAVSRSGQDQSNDNSTSETSESSQERETLDALLAQAQELAQKNDYEGALKLLRGYSGALASDESLTAKIQEYTNAYNSQTVPDITNVPILSFNTLIADYASAGNTTDHITTAEFSAILQQLYDGGYVLVSANDLDSGLRLPVGKKPIMLVLTDANYTGQAGYASRLAVDDNGKLVCELDQSNGSIYIGDYDLIPILSNFVAEHPDFSFNDARALIAVSGHDGIFGYAELSDAQTVIDAVKDEGYDFACYTYNEVRYVGMTTEEVVADAELWLQELAPVLGDVSILVYPYGSDFTDISSTAQLEALNGKGFDLFIGTNSSTAFWGVNVGAYGTMTRRWVNAAALTTKAENFADVFDGAQVLDAQRG